jgi:hypothetical protein
VAELHKRLVERGDLPTPAVAPPTNFRPPLQLQLKRQKQRTKMLHHASGTTGNNKKVVEPQRPNEPLPAPVPQLLSSVLSLKYDSFQLLNESIASTQDMTTHLMCAPEIGV